MSRFEFETVLQGQRALVTLRGELDMIATAELEPELERLAEHPTVEVVAVDLRGLDYLDSNGLRAVICARDQLEEVGMRLLLVRGPVEVQRVFEITRMTERLDFVDGV